MPDLDIHFLPPSDWANSIHLHYWERQPAADGSDWPGVRMEPDPSAPGWYRCRLSQTSQLHLVFNDGQGRQSADLFRDQSGWYQIDRGWQDQRPTGTDTASALAGATSAIPDAAGAIPGSTSTVASADAAALAASAAAPKAGGSAGAEALSAATPPRPQQGSQAPAPTTGPRPVAERTDFREETIYFLLTARFFDGDPSNNFFCRDRIRFDEQGNATDPHWRGDFKGLIQKLDYIRDLGFTAIWITPPVENRSGLDYHGYHPYDWTRIDPRLESPDATYQDLIDAAHAKGLKIIQDVVVNHSCQYGIRGQVHIDHLPIKYYVPQGSEPGRVDHGPYQGNLGNYAWPNRDDIDNPVAPDWYRERHARDPEGLEPLVDPQTGETVPKPGYNPGRFFGIDAQRLDPNWYHQDGFICGGDWESAHPLQQKHLAGDCIDLATERQNVKDYLIGAINRYLDMGVDALRIDTVKHVERDNLLEYVNAWKAHKPGLFVFGENLVKGYGWGDLGGGDNGPSEIRPWWYTRLGHDPRDPNSGGDSGFPQLDFGLFSTFRDTVSKGTYAGTAQILSMDWIYGDVTSLVTFLQNHDVGPDNDFKYRFKGEDWMAAAAYNLLWTARGIPCLYYGEEIAFMRGAPQDVEGEKDTLESTGRAYFGDHLEADRIAETQSHPLYRHLQRLNLIRRAIPALQKAQMTQVNEWGSGMSFVRDLSAEGSYVVIGLAIGSDQQVEIGGIRAGLYRDAVSGAEQQSDGHLSFQVKGSSAGIWVLDGPGKIGEDGPYLH
ncbi:MAG: alpha-amylase family glycosyl hydrolase [Lamprobacter sp.]|uniref:alpha-amylase family glycosyl hydrolase n=1 Tax=Lamprobacter sp. TaxID=3100796 RepID=UPI002B257FBD|nr:alpha-amylase family glycosyl hydrolase [Lamprobacter sp.]MEA3640387.1 alpha-amylase family glycosyl hydrolase [Lamprobacter sp.]